MEVHFLLYCCYKFWPAPLSSRRSAPGTPRSHRPAPSPAPSGSRHRWSSGHRTGTWWQGWKWDDGSTFYSIFALASLHVIKTYDENGDCIVFWPSNDGEMTKWWPSFHFIAWELKTLMYICIWTLCWGETINLPKGRDWDSNPLSVGFLQLAHLRGLLHTEVDLVAVLADHLQLDVLGVLAHGAGVGKCRVGVFSRWRPASKCCSGVVQRQARLGHANARKRRPARRGRALATHPRSGPASPAQQRRLET